jgi:hypothetical protein
LDKINALSEECDKKENLNPSLIPATVMTSELSLELGNLLNNAIKEFTDALNGYSNKTGDNE